MASVCGIEEAGRGPVIGPMVMCGLLIEEGDEQELAAIGVKDSKLLTPGKREQLYSKIKKIAKKCEVVVIQPDEIDGAVESDILNLNWLEASKAIAMINQLNPDKVIIDCPSTNIKAFKDYILNYLEKKEITLLCAHHADRDFPVVSAASIIAKVTRDALIEKLKAQLRVNFGSGYPADPITKAFLKDNWEKYPNIFRHSWASYKRVAAKKDQQSLSDF